MIDYLRNDTVAFHIHYVLLALGIPSSHLGVSLVASVLYFHFLFSLRFKYVQLMANGAECSTLKETGLSGLGMSTLLAVDHSMCPK